MRMEAQSAKIENGHVYLPEDALWLGPYLQELMAFPSSKYDDQVDSTSQYLKWTENARYRSSGGFKSLPRLFVYDEGDDW